jgi:DHA3 family macrolide efflux protein-like MFS transporter
MRNLNALVFLFSANLVSGFAQGVTMLAIPWHLVHHLGDEQGKYLNAAMVAVVTLASLFWGMYAGTLIDRYNRKRIFQVLNGVDFGLLILAGCLGIYLGEAPFFLLAAVFAITIFTYNVHYPNLYAFVQELFEPKYYAKVNSAIEMQGQLTNAVGMFVGGVLIAGSTALPTWWPEAWQFEEWSLGQIFLLDGSTYLLSLILISFIRYRPVRKRKVDVGPVLQRMKQGFNYLWQHKMLLVFGICSHLIFFALLITHQTITPIYVSDYLMAEAYALASFKGTYAIGALVASGLGMTILARKGHPLPKVIGMLLIACGVFATLAISRSLFIFLMCGFVIGIANAGTRILRITYIIKVVAPRVVGRVNSFFSVINVLWRFTFSSLMTLPFFAAPGNGENVVFALAILSAILLFGGVILIVNYRGIQELEIPEEEGEKSLVLSTGNG